jgi:hypothetical protein
MKLIFLYLGKDILEIRLKSGKDDTIELPELFNL